jgi:hypothetical protein
MRLLKGNAERASRSDALFAGLLALLFVGALPLRAYTDPGSGLLIWQMAGAFFVGCVYQLRKFLIRLRKRK